MKKSLLDYYKMKYGTGGKIPVRKTGMWYQEGDVVVPSNEITMEGPQGQPDYFKEPILGKGIPSGNLVLMKPGGKYKFVGDKAVYETKKYQTNPIVSNPSEGFTWKTYKDIGIKTQPTKSQIVATQGQQRSTAVARTPITTGADLSKLKAAQSAVGLKKSIGEVSKEIDKEEAIRKSAIAPTTEDIVKASNVAREEILSGNISLDNISNWFAAAPEKLKLSSPYSSITPGLSNILPESVKPTAQFLDNYFNPISFGGSFWSSAAQAGSEFSKGQTKEGFKSLGNAALVPAAMYVGQRIAPSAHAVESAIGSGLQKVVGNVGASAIMNSGPVGAALVTGLSRAAVGVGRGATKAGVQSAEKVGVHSLALAPSQLQMGGMTVPGINGTVVAGITGSTNKKSKTKKYQKGDVVSNTPISEEIMKRFRVKPNLSNQEFNYPSFVNLSQIKSLDKVINKSQDIRNLTPEMLSNPDISSSVLDMAKQTQLDLKLNRSGKVGDISLRGRGSFEDISKGQFNPLDIKAGLNLGSSGRLDYSRQIAKGEKLSKPTNQTIKGSIDGKKGRVSAYSSKDERGKTYGGSFAKTSGDVTYGGNVNYGPEGLQNIGGNLTASDLFNLTYARNREGEGFTNTIGAEIMPGQPLSVNFSRAYGNQGMNETTVGGNLNLKNLQASLSKTFTPEGSSMQGTVNTNLGKRVTLGATGDFTNNRLNKLGLRTGVNIIPGFSINAGVEQEIGGGKPKVTFKPTITKDIVSLTKRKKKTFTSIKNQLQQNQPIMEDTQVLKKGGRIKYQEEEYEEDDDREMVEGIADILKQVKDKKNRKQIAKEMVDDFEEEDVDYNLDDFMEAAKLMQMGGMSIPGVNGTVVASLPNDNLKTAYMKKGGQHGGLDRWFAEKWVDVKTGKPCGRQEGESRAYPACRPSKRVSSKTPKTSSEMSSSEKAKFKTSKTSSQRIPYNHKRK